mgnify:CR=1 FL=1
MTAAKADPIEMRTLPEERGSAVRERLRVILNVAIAVGRREGLLDKSCDKKNNGTGGSENHGTE